MKTKQIPLSEAVKYLPKERWTYFILRCRELAEQQEVKKNARNNQLSQ